MRGLSKAIVPLLKCIDDEVETYFVNQTHSHLPSKFMPKFVRAKLMEGRSQCWFSRKSWALTTLLPASLGLPLASLFTPQGTRDVSPSKGACLWVPVGIDPGTLVRAWCVAKRMKVPFHLYLVDDIETHPSNIGTRKLNGLISHILRDAARVYTITDELGDLLNYRYGVKTRRLPLIPDHKIINNHVPSKDVHESSPFAVYLGSINHLYEDGLKSLIDVVSRLRQETGKDLRVRLFSELAAVRRLCGGEIPNWIKAGPEVDDAVIRHQIETATLCFLPNSFDEKAREMVSTSFPSKLLDYLLSARAIVVFAPDYSISHKTLSVGFVPYVVSTPIELSDVLTRLAAKGTKNNDDYRAILTQQFSCNIVKQALSAPW